MIKGTTIPCPVCYTKIAFHTEQLLNGMQFECQTCKSKIGLAQESINTVQQVLTQLQDLKTRLRDEEMPNPNEAMYKITY